MSTTKTIQAQPGAQTKFLQCSTDICVFGGAAGSSKSYSLILEALRHVNNPDHRAMVFRRTSPMLRSPGAVYSEAKQLYMQLGADINDSRMECRFKSGATITFSHLQSEDHRLAHQGSQFSLLCLDEATHFTSTQVTYLISRLRNPSIRPYARLTTNPDCDSYVKTWIEPFLDSSGQFPNEEKCGKPIYIGFGGEEDKPIFNNTKTPQTPLSFTFIPGKLTDNQILLQKNPNYESMLMSLPLVERQRLLYGDWSISYRGGNVYKREWFRPTDMRIPGASMYLGFDLAATSKGDYSAAVLLSRNGPNAFIHRAWRIKAEPAGVHRWMTGIINEAINIARVNGSTINTYTEIEPGSASIRDLATMKSTLPACNLEGVRSTTSKIARARASSVAAEQGKVYYYPGTWWDEFISEANSFPSGTNDDQVDAFTLAYNQSNEVRRW